MNARLTAMLVLICLVLIFVFQNIDTITLSFLIWDVSMPRALMLFITLTVGVVIGILARMTKPDRENK
ncbi:MAG: LapA family protein [Desulfobacterales bacterium]|nr:LapA family protein [Desulfobacterales bacterium]